MEKNSFICENKSNLLSVIDIILNSIPVRVPFQRFVIKSVILPLCRKFIINYCAGE